MTLFITRRAGQSFLIGEDIEVYIDVVKRSGVRFAIRHPEGVEILRRELFDKIREGGAVLADAPPPLKVHGPGHDPGEGFGGGARPGKKDVDKGDDT